MTRLAIVPALLAAASIAPARLPVGIDFVGRPFDEPTLLRIASAYEAKTHHRAPPEEFGPLRAASP
jgi:Asp-tRNA(Asn)/Glu-tRNA(Gln) amidotransferase A subunit family amidase